MSIDYQKCASFLFIFSFLLVFSCSTDSDLNQQDPDKAAQLDTTDDTTDEMTDDNTDGSTDDNTDGSTDDNTDDANSNCENLIWSEEFEGTSLDESKWSYQRGGWSGASNVQNCYVDNNTSVSGGTLKITAKYEPGYDCFKNERDFTSGFIQTKDRVFWTYGYFEARVKVPASDSTWPAFWLSPQDHVYGEWPRSGEIDVFEIKGNDLNYARGNAHWGNSTSDRRQKVGTYKLQGQDASDWHIYAVEWTLGKLNFYIDGEYYHTIDDFKAPNATTHPGPFNIPFYIRLNMAVGGNYLPEPHNDANNNLDQLPATMEVDYVRVYSEKPGC